MSASELASLRRYVNKSHDNCIGASNRLTFLSAKRKQGSDAEFDRHRPKSKLGTFTRTDRRAHYYWAQQRTKMPTLWVRSRLQMQELWLGKSGVIEFAKVPTCREKKVSKPTRPIPT